MLIFTTITMVCRCQRKKSIRLLGGWGADVHWDNILSPAAPHPANKIEIHTWSTEYKKTQWHFARHFDFKYCLMVWTGDARIIHKKLFLHLGNTSHRNNQSSNQRVPPLHKQISTDSPSSTSGSTLIAEFWGHSESLFSSRYLSSSSRLQTESFSSDFTVSSSSSWFAATNKTIRYVTSLATSFSL